MKIFVKASTARKVWHIDFYGMIGDLIPIQSIYILVNGDKESARKAAQRYAAHFGYNVNKIMVQDAYRDEEWFNSQPQESDRAGMFRYVPAS